MPTCSKFIRTTLLAPCLVLAALPAGAGEFLTPTFSKDFTEKTIGPGSTSRLRFDIDNTEVFPVEGLEFVDNLPASVTIADPANAATDCGVGLLDAPAGGTTITFTGGELGASSSCFVTVDVTSATPGIHMNVSGDLTSSFGNSGPAIADLTVDTSLLGFTKAFSPNAIVEGDTSSLTFSIDNTPNANQAVFISFLDNLPPGLVVAAISNASTDCDNLSAPFLTAVPGAGSISLSNASLAASSSCTVVVDVTAESAGSKGNTTEDLVFSPDFGGTFPLAGRASATLEVTRPFLRKLFTDDPVPPGGDVTLEFTITNFDRLNSATDITFTDDLDAALSGLEAVGLPLADPCGSGSQLSGTSLLTFTDGNLGPEGSCTFSVTLPVPNAAAPGAYVNTTSSVTTMVDGEVVVEDPASDDLIVAPVPEFTKSFLDDPVTGGDTVTLQFSITNTSSNFGATGIAFDDIIFDFLPSATGPGTDPCGAGSSAIFVPASDFDPAQIFFSGGDLAADASCFFDFVLDVAPDVESGTYSNITSDIAATIDGASLTGPPASDDLVVVAGPTLRKDFTDDPALPDGTVTLEFTIDVPAEAPGDVTDIGFTDDLSTVLAGLEATGLPINDVCGTGSQLSGTSLLTFTGGSLSPGESCSFSATLQMPGVALPGRVTNTTSSVDAMSLGLAVTSPPAEADLEIGGLTFTKTFTDDPVVAGDTVDLEFTIDNLSTVASVNTILFTDNLDATLDSLTALGLPIMDPCGAGSQLTGMSADTLLVLTGGTLLPSTSCTFSVTLQVPGAAEVGDYGNTTSSLSANFGSNPVVIDPASDVLSVFAPLTLSKLFLDDPVLPGDTVALEFTITNASAQESISAISFDDDLDAALSGLAASGLPANDVCGAGSQITGTGLLSFAGGSLGPDESCTFQVDVDVPVSAPLNTTAMNITSEVLGSIGGQQTSGDPATDDLLIQEVFCSAPDGETLVLQDDTIDEIVNVSVCIQVDVGPNLTVAGPNGALVIRTGQSAVFQDGTVIDSDAILTVGIDESLQP